MEKDMEYKKQLELALAEVQRLRAQLEDQQVEARQASNEERFQVLYEEVLRLKTQAESKEHGTLKIRQAQPSKFSGDEDEVEHFIHSCRLSFKVEGDKLSEEKKVLFATSYLDGRAKTWFMSLLNEDSSLPACMSTFTGFAEQLRLAFVNVDVEVKAADELSALKQTGEVKDYIVKFRNLATKVGWNDEALSSRFLNGLRAEFFNQIVLMGRKKDLQGVILQAIEVDRRFNSTKSLPHATAAPMPRPMPQDNTRTPPLPAQGDPMEIDAMRGEPRPRPRLPRWNLRGICFACGQRGHYARECPFNSRTAKPTGRINLLDGNSHQDTIRICSTCRAQGHWYTDCPLLEDSPNPSTTTSEGKDQA